MHPMPGCYAIAWPAGDGPEMFLRQGVLMDNTMVDEDRRKGSRRARAHGVTTGQCPKCGVELPAAVAAAVKRGDERCWR